MQATHTIAAKSSNSGSIHDVASDAGDRVIRFGTGCKYAVVLASYYGGKGYSTHKTAEAAIAAAKRAKGYSYEIIGLEGETYIVQPGYWADTLIRA